MKQIANVVDKIMTDVECKVADQVETFNEAKFKLMNILDKPMV